MTRDAGRDIRLHFTCQQQPNLLLSNHQTTKTKGAKLMSVTPSKVFSVRLSLRNFALIWQALEQKLGEPVPKEKVLSTLLKSFALLQGQASPITEEEAINYLAERGVSAGQAASRELALSRKIGDFTNG